ncbi:hypothetical protein BURKHO8Y_120078 [Burkholderia sp. 8Y]|nr:hypothetical protein BURKHO8Y_120078 [Burkholderia sp. 8Y]
MTQGRQQIVNINHAMSSDALAGRKTKYNAAPESSHDRLYLGQFRTARLTTRAKKP